MNLKEIESNTWETNYIDGIPDIAIGLLIGISTFFRFNPDISPYYWILMLLSGLYYGLAKKYISIPRIGHIKFRKERIKKIRLSVLFMCIVLCVLFSFIFFMIFRKAEWLQWIQNIPYILLIVSFGLFLIWSSIGYIVRFERMYLYAFLMATSVFLTFTNGLAGLLSWSITTVIMVAIGVYYQVKFIKKYPIPKGI